MELGRMGEDRLSSIRACVGTHRRVKGRRRPRRLKPSLALSLIRLPGPDRFRCWPSGVQCSQICGSGVRNMSCDFEAIFGEIVGKGAQATVYAKGEHAVKLYREDYPKRNVFIEAYVMANLELVNFPGPRIYEILLVNGRYGLRMDRVKGEMMSEEFRDPARCKDTRGAGCRSRRYRKDPDDAEMGRSGVRNLDARAAANSRPDSRRCPQHR